MRRHYFRCGDVDDLAEKLVELCEAGSDDESQEGFRELVRNKYNWNTIADQTKNVYRLAYGEASRQSERTESG